MLVLRCKANIDSHLLSRVPFRIYRQTSSHEVKESGLNLNSENLEQQLLVHLNDFITSLSQKKQVYLCIDLAS